MPEIAEVAVNADAIREKILGFKLTSFHIPKDSNLDKQNFTDLKSRLLGNIEVIGVKSRGKKLIIELYFQGLKNFNSDNSDNEMKNFHLKINERNIWKLIMKYADHLNFPDSEAFLVFSLGMTGCFSISKSLRARAIAISTDTDDQKEKHSRLKLKFKKASINSASDDGERSTESNVSEILSFNDQRKFGDVDFYSCKEDYENNVVNVLGPDLLNPENIMTEQKWREILSGTRMMISSLLMKQ